MSRFIFLFLFLLQSFTVQAFPQLTVRYDVTNVQAATGFTDPDTACITQGYLQASYNPNLWGFLYCVSPPNMADSGVWIYKNNVDPYCPSNSTVQNGTCVCDTGYQQNDYLRVTSCSETSTWSQIKTAATAAGVLGLSVLAAAVGCVFTAGIACAGLVSLAVTSAIISVPTISGALDTPSSQSVQSAPSGQPLQVVLSPTITPATNSPAISRDSSGNLSTSGSGWSAAGTVSILTRSNSDKGILETTTVDTKTDTAKRVVTTPDSTTTSYISGSGGVNGGGSIVTYTVSNSTGEGTTTAIQFDQAGEPVNVTQATCSGSTCQNTTLNTSPSGTGTGTGSGADSGSGSSTGTGTGTGTNTGSGSGTGTTGSSTGNGDCVSFGCATEATLKKIYDFFTWSSTSSLNDLPEQAPTDVFSPISNSVDSFLHYSIPTHSSQCPTWHRVVSISEWSFPIDIESHCVLIEEHRSFIHNTAMLCWSILVVLIILGA